jgi:hypothetical protein
MFDVLTIVIEVYHWVLDAAVAYNSTDEGATRLADIETRLEALGIDVPGFTPTVQGEPLDMNFSSPVNGVSQSVKAEAFRQRHPELFNQEGTE